MQQVPQHAYLTSYDTGSNWVTLSPQYVASLGIPQYELSPTTSVLGKRKSEGHSSRRSTVKNSSTHYRGITNHPKAGRWESHIWTNGTQVYLGGFYNEQQAALAYDLAAIRFRSREANTNFDISLFKQEIDDSEESQTSHQDVVLGLRSQSKAMNKVATGKGVAMAPWELELSQVIHGDKVGLGVYGTEIEAAKAYDREMVRRYGILAGELINFQLLDYIDMLDPTSIFHAVQQGLIPADSCAFYIPDDTMMVSPEASPLSTDLPGDGKLGRRISVTPRSILDIDDEATMQ